MFEIRVLFADLHEKLVVDLTEVTIAVGDPRPDTRAQGGEYLATHPQLAIDVRLQDKHTTHHNEMQYYIYRRFKLVSNFVQSFAHVDNVLMIFTSNSPGLNRSSHFVALFQIFPEL